MTVAKWTRSWFIVSDSMHSSAFGNEKRHTIYLTKRTGDKMATVARPDLHCGPCLSHNAHTLYIRMYIHKLGYRARCQSIILYVALTNIHGYRTLRPQDTSASVSRYFDTSAVIKEKPGHFDPGQFLWDAAPPLIRLKLQHQFCGAEVSQSVLMPNCLVAELSGSHILYTGKPRNRQASWQSPVQGDSSTFGNDFIRQIS